jgi:endonuclease-3
MFRRNKNIPSLLKALKKNYADAFCALHHDTPLQLLVATILSAQCTDERVNKVTPALFNKYRSAEDFACAAQEEVEQMIRSTGFYRNKAKNIRGMARMLVDKHGGDVPRTMPELLELPGVARKTANVVLGNAFGLSEGIVVDTHVTRLSERLGLSRQNSAEKIEEELVDLIPKSDWIWFSHALISHGRAVCMARNPKCSECPIQNDCPNPFINRKAPHNAPPPKGEE